MRHRRIGNSEDSQFTAEEIEIAGILILFGFYSERPFLQWGAKRKRSASQRDESSATHNSKRSLLEISASENDYELEHGSMAMAPPPPPACRLPSISCLNSKNVKAKNLPRKRAPKRKTHRELMEMVDDLSLENSRLIKAVEQMRKTNQDLKDCNIYMKSELALYLDQRQEKNMSYTSRPSSSDSDTREETETPTTSDDFQRCDKHEHFEIFSGGSALVLAYDKPHSLGRPMYPCSPESSFGVEKDGAMFSSKDTVYSGFIDLNVPDEVLYNTNVSNDLHD